MAATSSQSRKVAWLEAMLDTSIVAYESHRNALENIYAQLAQWQQPQGTGCIHIGPAEVNELLRDITDVLDQCALQLQPLDGNDDAQPKAETASSNHPPTHSSGNHGGAEQRSGHPAMEEAEDSRASSSDRGVTREEEKEEESMRSSVQDRPAAPPKPQQQQQQQTPLHQRTPSATPSQASSVPPRSQREKKSGAAATAVPAPPADSIADTRSPPAKPPASEHKPQPQPPTQPQQQQEKQKMKDAAEKHDSNNNGEVDSVAPPASASPSVVSEAKPAPSARSATSHASAPSSRQPPQQQQQQQQRADDAPPPSRPQMQPCPHHKNRPTQRSNNHNRNGGLALSPWPIINNGRDDAAATGGALPPSAAARAAATRDELPAEQYSAYRETGTPLETSMERQSAAAALERRAREEEQAKRDAVYLPPTEGDVANRAAARARQPAPTANLDASRASSRASAPPPRPQQQQQEPTGTQHSSVRTVPLSTEPSSVAGHPSKQQQQQQQQRGNPLQSNGSSHPPSHAGAEDRPTSHSRSKHSLEEIPRRRGSSAAADGDEYESMSERSSIPPSQQSRLSQPSRQPHPQRQTYEGSSVSANDNSPAPRAGSRTPSHVGSAGRPTGATAAPPAEKPAASTVSETQPSQQQQPHAAASSRASSTAGSRHGPANGHPSVYRQLNTADGDSQPGQQQQQRPTMDASQVGSVGLVQTPSATPQRSTPDNAPQPQQQQMSQAPLVPGEHRPLRTAVPRRTTPRAYDSSQSEDAVFHRRRSSPGRPPVRADSPKALRYMDREDSQLRQRRDEELAEVHADPRVLAAQLAAGGQPQHGEPLRITDGAAAGRQVMAVDPSAALASKSTKAVKAPMTALEEQLVAEHAVLVTQLEKMQMEVTIATARNKEWGNERRYSQVNARMTRVLGDLDRVEKELRVVRNIDRAERGEPNPQTW